MEFNEHIDRRLLATYVDGVFGGVQHGSEDPLPELECLALVHVVLR